MTVIRFNMTMNILRLFSLLVIKVSLETSRADYTFSNSQKTNNPGRKFE